MNHEELLRQRFGPDSFTTSQFRDNRRIIVSPERVCDFLQCLKEQAGFDMLFELTAADYLKYPGAKDRYGVVYGIVNTTTGERLYLRTFVNHLEPPVPAAVALW